MTHAPDPRALALSDAEAYDDLRARESDRADREHDFFDAPMLSTAEATIPTHGAQIEARAVDSSPPAPSLILPCAIPLRARDGLVRTYAWVDPEDYGWVSEHRWHGNPGGYAIRSLKPGVRDNRKVKMHREILGLESGDRREGDHINGDKLDNRRCNLRILTGTENRRAFLRPRGGTSRFRGVHRRARTGHWRATARLNGKSHSLGTFVDEIDAAVAVNNFWTARGYDAPNDVGATPRATAEPSLSAQPHSDNDPGGWSVNSRPSGESQCPRCGGEMVVAIGPPDRFGNYETTDCECAKR